MKLEDRPYVFRWDDSWGRSVYWERKRGGVPWINLLLFVLTLLTTTYAGAQQRGVDLLRDFSRFEYGLPFALTLMSILLVHELGHYTLARIHGVNATLPYFIPSPSFIGTFGAFIRMKSRPRNRRHLFDVGAAGPLAGFCVAVPAVYVGLKLSAATTAGGSPESGIAPGSSLLFSFLSFLALGNTPESVDIMRHPIGFAGWIGLFITAMNLIPTGQLDGGHVLYALLGWRHRRVSRLSVLVVFILGLLGWEGWFFWAFLLWLMGTRHPPTMDTDTPLDWKRIWLGCVTLVILIVTFVPVPFKLPGGVGR